MRGVLRVCLIKLIPKPTKILVSREMQFGDYFESKLAVHVFLEISHRNK